jgi:hypothetical protein
MQRLTIVRDRTAADGEVETSLEDGVLAAVTVDANPSGGGVGARRARGLLGGRNREGSRHGLVGALREADQHCSVRNIESKD